MSRSSLRRHQAARIRKRWEDLLKALGSQRHRDLRAMGKTFKTDPFDCGNPECGICSYGKVFDGKRGRLTSKKQTTQEILQELEFDANGNTN